MKPAAEPGPPIASTSASAEHTASSKRIVTAFYERAFVQHQPTAAAQAYLGTQYVQHNPRVPDGADAFVAFFEDFLRASPGFTTTIHRIIAEGDLVVIHAHARKDPDDAGLAIADMFRVAGDRIVEHWDVIQPVVTQTASGNAMF